MLIRKSALEVVVLGGGSFHILLDNYDKPWPDWVVGVTCCALSILPRGWLGHAGYIHACFIVSVVVAASCTFFTWLARLLCGILWGIQGELEVLIEVCLEREGEPQHPLGYMLGGLVPVVVMLAWIGLYKKSGPWYKKFFGQFVRFVGKSVDEPFGGVEYLLLEEISDHTFDGEQVKGKPFPLQSFGVVIALVIVTAVTIIYCVVPLAKENPQIKKWIDEVGINQPKSWRC
jgi:hypothetical protein